MIKKSLFSLIGFIVLWSSCEKNSLELAEESAIKSYIESLALENNDPTASGLYYIVTKQPDDTVTDLAPPNQGDTIVFSYTGKMLTQGQNVYYSTTEPMSFVLGVDKTFKGLEEGLSYVQIGSECSLVVPSALAYGDVQVGDVPPYTPLLIELKNISIKRTTESRIALEKKAIEAYITSDSIDVAPSATGLYYILTKSPDETVTDLAPPSQGDTIIFSYTGKMLTQNQAEYYKTTEPMRFVLGVDEAIKGLEEGLSQVQNGSEAKLIVPSNLGYGNIKVDNVPPYTPLLIELKDISIKRGATK